MENKPLVSVCMISYNHEAFISQAIEGVLMQKTDFPIELVIGEDCSTDRTREICLEYQQKHPNIIRLLPRDKNLGMMPNFIDTLENSKEKYIALCEGDDYWTDPLKLQKQVNFLKANSDFAICFHRVKIVYEEESREILSNENQKEVLEFEDLALRNYIHTPSCVFRNGLFEKFPDWFYQSPVGDWVLHLLNAQHGKIKFLEDVMAVYRIHNNGVWSLKDPITSCFEWIKVAENCHDYFYPKASNIFLRNIANSRGVVSFTYFNRSMFKEFRDSYWDYMKQFNNAALRMTVALTIRYLFSYIPFIARKYKGLSHYSNS